VNTMTTLPRESTNDANGCSPVASLLGAQLDGQLDTVTTLTIEEHLAACEGCREKLALERAIRGSLKKVVKTEMGADARARMLAAMAAAEADGDAPDESTSPGAEARRSQPPAEISAAGLAGREGRGALRHWRTMLPLASAAAIAVGWGFASKQPMTALGHEELRAGFGNDEILRELATVHGHPLSPERTDPKDVRAFERDVGVSVKPPLFKGNARFLGGRVLPVHHGSERAAMLQYEIVRDNHVQRVSVFVYDPRRVQVSGAGFAPRAVGTSEVRVGQAGGYSVAVTQRGEVGYAFASDMDLDSSATLAADAE
jgi:anti-sigma factor RsiW